MKTSAEKSSSTPSKTATQAAQPFFAKAGGGNFFAPTIQMKLAVNKPGDKFEQEADSMAYKIMRMPTPAAGKEEKIQRKPEEKIQKKEDDKIQKAAMPEEKIQKKEEDKIQKAPASEEKLQRDGTGVPAVSANVQSAIQNKTSGGQPLSSDVRSYMDPRFNADFSNVRVHHDAESASLNNQLSARAFTHQNHIFFSRDQYQPGASEGKQLLAHELTHTIQQGHAVQRSPQVSTTTTPPSIQRLGMQDALDYFADKAGFIPGFTLLTVLLGFNPINRRSVDRSAANILKGLIELIPGGVLITQALNNHGVLTKAGAWVEQQIATLGDIGSDIVAGLKRFMDSLSWTDIFDLSGVWERAKSIFTNPIGRLISFAAGVAIGIMKLVKEAVLRPLAKMAEGTAGYDLLKAVLGQDPVTGDPVPRTAETLIGGFMKLIGQEEIWENIKKGNAVARAWAWFQGALAGLMAFVRAIPAQIIATISSITWQDVITIVGVFSKVGKAFLGIAGEFLNWAGAQVISLLEIIFSVVAPDAVPYIKKAQNAFQTIIKNPIGFVGNLVRAGKLGFQMFANNIGTHLKTALIKWITGPLGEAGVYIPKSFDLMEIIKLVLSILGLTWQNIRTKLVKIIPEPILTGLEKTAGILVTLVKDGPVAAWEQIKTELSELKDSLITKVTEMITTEVVKAAVVKLVSMLNPAGAVIQAIIAIYKTITFFVEKIKQIAAVVASFIDSIAAIASGQIDGAAKKVEQTMANTLTIIIAFLAKFAGLGDIPEKIVGIIKKIRSPIDKGLDKIVAWLGGLLQKIGGAIKSTANKVFNWANSKSSFQDDDGHSHSIFIKIENNTPKLTIASQPMAVEQFLEFYLNEKEKKNPSFKADNASKITNARTAISAAQVVITQIEIAQKAGKDEATLQPMQNSLLEKNVGVSRALSALVGNDSSIKNTREKYLLEGLTGTYSSIPKPKGDGFTADHQPQAAILQAAAEFGSFTETGQLAKRALGRAKEGYAINLHSIRHMAGSTFGGKGNVTKQSFINTIEPNLIGKTKVDQRKIVIQQIKIDLNRDVQAMKSVAAPSSAYWTDITELKAPKSDKDILIKEISGRIVTGESQIAAQNIDTLVN